MARLASGTKGDGVGRAGERVGEDVALGVLRPFRGDRRPSGETEHWLESKTWWESWLCLTAW